MSASLPLMALLNADPRPRDRNDSAHAAPSAEDAEAFADLLAEHLPAELQAAIKQMSPEQLATLEQAALAADGKSRSEERRVGKEGRAAGATCRSRKKTVRQDGSSGSMS